MADQLGIAVLGCGHWGVNYVRVFNELPDSKVVAIAEQREGRLQEVGKRFPDVKLTTNAEEAVRTEGVDAVVVALQATLHYDITRMALETGKHILVEKPMTMHATESEELVKIAESQGVILMVGHTFLYNSGVRKVREYIENAEVGRVYYLYSSRTNLGPIRQDVNAVWDLATHDVSIFNYLLDATPEWVSAVGIKALGNNCEDVGFASIGYPGGVVGHIHVSWAEPNKVREVVVVGSDKRIVFNDLDIQERVRVFEKGVAAQPEVATYGEFQYLMRDGDIISPRVPVSEPLKNQCNHFLECVTENKKPLTDGRNGLDVVRVMEAIDCSIQRKGEPVQI